MTDPIQIVAFDELQDRKPAHALVENTDLVVIRFDDDVSVLYGRCLHRGALLADGFVDKRDNLICGVHNWDYRIDTGVSEYNNSEVLHKFDASVIDGQVVIDRADVIAFEELHPQPFKRSRYLGSYDDTHPEPEEPYTRYIQELSRNGLKNTGHHGPSAAMGVERDKLPKWESIQFLPAQLASRPLLDDEEVGTDVVIGPRAERPLVLKMPVFVSDMSFGPVFPCCSVTLYSHVHNNHYYSF